MRKIVVFPLLTIALCTTLLTLTTETSRAEKPTNPLVPGQSPASPSQTGITVAQPNNGLTPQLVTNQRAITAIGQGQIAAPADSAQLEFIFANRNPNEDEGSPDESIADQRKRTETALKPIVDILLKNNVAIENITIQTSSLTTPKLLVKLLNKPTRERVQEIVTSVDRATKASRQFAIQSIGAAYSVNNCLPLERAARRIALRDAQSELRTLATDLNVQLGELIFVTVLPFASPTSVSTCGTKVGVSTSDLLAPSNDSLPPYDSSDPIEVQVRSQVGVTYGVQ